MCTAAAQAEQCSWEEIAYAVIEYKSEALLFIALGLYQEAFKYYNKALELTPMDEEALLGRCKTALKIGDPEQALNDAEKLLKKDPGNLEALYMKAEALYCAGDFELALVIYERGRQFCPDVNDFRIGVQKAAASIHEASGGISCDTLYA